MPTPSHDPTDKDRRQVEMMAGLGLPQDQICLLINVSKPTLHAYYRDELDRGMAQANARVAQSLYRAATDWMDRKDKDGKPSKEPPPREAVTASIFWAKARMGWRETAQVEVTGKNGAPIQHEQVESARDRIARRVQRLAANLPLLPASIERDVAETEAQDEADAAGRPAP